MRPSTPARPRRSVPAEHLGRPRGRLAPRVQAAGPEHFGIVAIDPAKARSCWMLADFYGRALIPLTTVEHTRSGFEAAIARLKRAIAEHQLRDRVVAIEQTGSYHRPVKRAFAAAGLDTRVVHPSISRHFRQAGAFDTKADRTDVEGGIFRATIDGFGLQETPRDPPYTTLQFWARHRRDLVEKAVRLRCQILEHLEACLPGYARCFDDIFNVKIGPVIPRRYATPTAVARAGTEGLTQLARAARVRVQRRTLLRILGWAQDAAAPDPDATLHQGRLLARDDDRIDEEMQIHSCERDPVAQLVPTPHVRLLAPPGIDVVTAGELAGEAGPIVHYATARVITGRAGLYPRRYQSDRVDLSAGHLARRGNRRLRRALLLAADTLIRGNDHFRVLAAQWGDPGIDPRAIPVRVAGRFARIAFPMVAGTAAVRHPAGQGPPAVLSKLMEFQDVHEIDSETTQTNLRHAAAQLPGAEPERERASLAAHEEESRARRGRKARQGNAIPAAVLRQLGGNTAPPRGSTPSASAPTQKDENIKTTHASTQKDENINIKTTRTNLGPTAAPLSHAPPVREPAAPPRPGPAGRVRRGRGPQPFSAILPAVLQRRGGEAAPVIESTLSGETP
jgi:transposase